MCPVRVSGHMVLVGSWGPTLSNSGLSTFCFLCFHCIPCISPHWLQLAPCTEIASAWDARLVQLPAPWGTLIHPLFVFLFFIIFIHPLYAAQVFSLKSVLTPYLAPKHLSHLLPNKIASIVFYFNLPIYKVHLLSPPKWLDIAQMHAPEQVHSRPSVDICWMTEWSTFKG